MLIAAFFSFGALFGAPELQTTTRCWQAAEVTLTAKRPYDNPYMDVTVTISLSGPGGRRMRLEAFWDGGNIWRFRFAPPAPGLWRWRSSANPPGDPGLHGISGIIRALPNPKSHGFVTVSRKFPHHFAFADGTPFYFSGCNYLREIDKVVPGGTFREERIRHLFATRAQQGFTVVWWMNWLLNKPLFRLRQQANEGGPVFYDYDLRRINPNYFKGTDRRVRLALSYGLRPTFSIGWPDQGHLQLPRPLLERGWRYIIARYCAYDVTWVLFGEFEEAGRNAVEITRHFARLTRLYDPYRHPLTTHTVDSNNEFARDDWLDFIVHQSQNWRLIEADWAFGKPIVNSEWYYENRTGARTRWRHIITDMELFRRSAWNIRMRGAYLVYEVWSRPDDWPQVLTSPGARYVAAINKLFEARKFWLYEPLRNVASNALAIGIPGREMVVYAERGGQVLVRVKEPQRWSARLYDPRTGQFVSSGKAVPAPDGLLLRCPDDSDWAWLLTRRGGA